LLIFKLIFAMVKTSKVKSMPLIALKNKNNKRGDENQKYCLRKHYSKFCIIFVV